MAEVRGRAGPFSEAPRQQDDRPVDPPAESPRELVEEPPSRRMAVGRALSWFGVTIVVVGALGWFWLTSTPGVHPFAAAPFLLLFVVSALAALAFVALWAIGGRIGARTRRPWGSAAALGLLVIVVVGSFQDAGPRARFELHRDEFERVGGELLAQRATGAADLPAQVGEVGGIWISEVVEASDGLFFLTGAGSGASGFVYLPGESAKVITTEYGSLTLRPLGDGWHLTTGYANPS